MKIIYHDSKVKIIPKKYALIRDVSKYFMSDSLRLTGEERELLEEKYYRQVFDSQIRDLKKELSIPVKELLGGKAVPEAVNKIFRWKQSSYFEVVFTGVKGTRHLARVLCPEKIYTTARKLKSVKTEEIRRGY